MFLTSILQLMGLIPATWLSLLATGKDPRPVSTAPKTYVVFCRPFLVREQFELRSFVVNGAVCRVSCVMAALQVSQEIRKAAENPAWNQNSLSNESPWPEATVFSLAAKTIWGLQNISAWLKPAGRSFDLNVDSTVTIVYVSKPTKTYFLNILSFGCTNIYFAAITDFVFNQKRTGTAPHFATSWKHICEPLKARILPEYWP